MKKYMALLLTAVWASVASAELYSYTKTGSETIDGVTWQYCVSNNEARVISTETLGSYNRSDGDVNERWRLCLRDANTSYYSYSYYSSSSYYYYYHYYSAISSSTTGAVAVPSELGGYPVVAIDYYAFGYCAGLTQVTIPEGVREIGPGAFFRCTALTTVNLPESLTKIDLRAFDGCTKLSKVTIPSAVKTVGEQAFYSCSAMTEVTISPGVETIDSFAFCACSKLERLLLPSSVKYINDFAFQQCSGLTSVVLPEGLKAIGRGAFNVSPYYNYEYIGWNDGRSESLYYTNYGYGNESSLSSITIPSSVTNVGEYAFYCCDALKKVVINAPITKLNERMFCKCYRLQAVVLPDTIVEIGSRTFESCSSLTDINIPAGVTEIGSSAFSSCSSLVDFKIPAGVKKIQDSAFNSCTKLIGIELPDGLLSIGSCAFYYCTSLTHADIPNSVTLINANAFVYCMGLERITLPGSINTMASGAFNCPNATVIFEGGVPNYSVSDAGLLNSKAISYPREYGAAWQKVLGTAQFGGYTQTHEELPEVVIVSAQMRPTDSTILDVVYRVKSKDAKVHVRVLAFENGVRSFANVIRPETFVDDTAANVGDNITANEDHTISWRVSADWKTDLSKMKFEVLAMRNNYLPLELITIPAIEGHAAMTITWNSLSPAQIINALYWIYADKDANFSVTSGNLKNGATTLMQGATLSNSSAALSYIYSKMGYSVLSGDKLTYARQATRLPLADVAGCPFAVKND